MPWVCLRAKVYADVSTMALDTGRTRTRMHVRAGERDERHYARHDPLVVSIHDSSENEYKSGPKGRATKPSDSMATHLTVWPASVPLLEFRFVLRF